MSSALRSRLVAVLVVMFGAVTVGLGTMAGATTSTPGQPRVYVPDARTIVEVDGDKYSGWTVYFYDHSIRTIPPEAAARQRCATFHKLPKQVRCQGTVNQRNRDYRALQQGLAYAHALAAD